MSDYILETTPLNRSESRSRVLLLGHWCKLNSDLIKYQIVDYHWDDRDKLYSDYQLIFSLYEVYLERLTVSLNQLHNLDYTVDFWRMLVGPWLYYFICIVFDRHQMVLKASDNFDIKYTRGPHYDSDDWVPLDYVDFNYKFDTDEWNYYLFSEIIKHTKLIVRKKTSYHLSPNILQKKDRQNWTKRISKNILFLLTKLTNKYLTRVLFTEVDIPQTYLHRMLFKLKSFPISYYLRVRPKFFILNRSMRDSLLNSNRTSSSIEKLLDNLIPYNIPISYIEGYQQLVKDSKTIFPKKVNLIVTSNAYFSNEHFKVWAATQKLHKVKLWVLVHGGHHGTALFNGPGKLTEDIADRFYCWGWGKYNLPSSKLSLLREHKLPRLGRRLLFIPYSLSRYSNHIDSSPVSSTFNDCLKMQCDFFGKLKTSNLMDDLFIRLKSSQNLWNLQEEYENCGARRFILSDEESLLDSISKSSLVIVTYDSTVFLEALTLNTPTCLFINKEYWEMSSGSIQYFEQFLECGILHHDANSLIKHVVTTRNDIDNWWYSNTVQDAITSFLEKFGSSSVAWQKDWYDEINHELKIL